MNQEIKCSICNTTVLGFIELNDEEIYKGDSHYGLICDQHAEETNNIQIEYDKYLKRKSDGEKAFLMLMSELRILSIENNLPREVNRYIENKLEFVKSQVIEGQWISALEKLEEVTVEGYLSQNLYDRIHLSITNYISQNY